MPKAATTAKTPTTAKAPTTPKAATAAKAATPARRARHARAHDPERVESHESPASTEQAKEPKGRRRHESRAIALLKTLMGEGAVQSGVAVPRVAHATDALVRVDAPGDFWGPLGPMVANRTIILEHVSRAPSLRGLWTGLAKLAWTVTAEWQAIANRDRRYPLLLFLSASCPKWIRSKEGGFVPIRPAGAHALVMPMPAGCLFVHLGGLPEEPGLSVLRLMASPRSEAEMKEGIARLMRDPAVLQSTKEAILEAIMNQRIPATEPERWISVEAIRKEARTEALLDVARRRCDSETLRELEATTDMQELERRVLALVETH